MGLNTIHFVEARDLPDLWFQAVYGLFDLGRKVEIDKGSFEKQESRLEYDYFIGHVKYPGHGSGTPEILPQIPAHLGIPNPVEFEYVYGGGDYKRSYLEYVMTSRKEPGESYTYGERLTKFPIMGSHLEWISQKNSEIIDERLLTKKGISELRDKNIIFEENGQLYLNQIEWVIDTYKKFGYRNNQMVLQIAHPSDCVLKDPPCWRHADTRIQDDELSFALYFRSWDLWAAFAANLAAIQELKNHMAGEIGVKDGDMLVGSKGLHIYGYVEELAKIRLGK